MIDPIAVQLGPLSIHWYGIIMATAILLAALLGTAEARRRGEDPEVGWSMLLWVAVGGVVGARIYHVIHQWNFYAADPALIPQVWIGGLGIPGAVAGGALALVVYTRLNRLHTARWLDIFVIALPLGQAVGRLGNFVNQELYGPPTDLPWGIPIDAAHRIGEWTNLSAFPVDATRFHPLFAYEALLSLATLGLLLWISRRIAHRLYDGDMLLIYLMCYGAVRSYLETFRVQNWLIAGIPTATWIGIGGLALAGGFLILRHARGWGTPGAWMRPKDDADAAAPAGGGSAEAPAG
ncbi:MAG TPA: prolipoprotein diacylglyceryl transferase [Candidatus Limnocylindria bacterium]|nr:prolipoprotein diacylglyceryl transferase [Candidatus Limnocylindria bacterium]